VNVPTKLAVKAKDVALGREQVLIVTLLGNIEILGGPNKGPVEGITGPIRVSNV